MLGDEDVALEILEFVSNFTQEIDAKKILYEFMGRVWGNGNTVLHLASFMGMCDLVKRLLELGAAQNKVNERKYKPVDCADDDEMRKMFSTVTALEPPTKQQDELSESQNRTRLRAISNIDMTKNEESDIIGIGPPPSPRPADNLVMKKRHSIQVGESNLQVPVAPAQTLSPDVINTSASPSANSTIKRKPPKFLRKVTFDKETLIFDLCSTGDPTDSLKLPQLRNCLGIPADAEVKPSYSEPRNLAIDVNEIYTVNQWLSPLHLACSSGNAATVELLLFLAGSKVNFRDKEGWTALHCACAEGHVEIVKLLGRCQGSQDDTDKNDDWIYPPDGPIQLNARNAEGETPVDVCLADKKDEISTILNALMVHFPQDSDDEDWQKQPSDDDSESDSESSDIEEQATTPKLISRSYTTSAPTKSAIKSPDSRTPVSDKNNARMTVLSTNS
ncbi:MAG: hypothetical protein SGCHY_004497 [Lobulomycetales sp.]